MNFIILYVRSALRVSPVDVQQYHVSWRQLLVVFYSDSINELRPPGSIRALARYQGEWMFLLFNKL